MKADSKKKVLIIATHRRDRSPNQRFRIEQYIDYLEENGFEITLSNILSEEDDKIFYSPGNIIGKAKILLRSVLKRRSDLRSVDHYNLVFFVRESLLTRGTWFEKGLKKRGIPYIFDFDDAIWLSDVSEANKAFAWLKDPSKIETSIKLATLVFAGNEYLSNYASQFNRSVMVVPTTIDTSTYLAQTKTNLDPVIIGWSGSLTTMKHFEYALPFLIKIRKEFGSRVKFEVIGDSNYTNLDIDVKGKAWSKKSELQDLASFDIGIMPLPNDEWAKGKCGLKGLQYMALGIPTIMSPVGVNSQIIRHGENGFLASTEEEWITLLRELILNSEKRQTIGQEARKTVESKYATLEWKDIYLDTFRKLAK